MVFALHLKSITWDEHRLVVESKTYNLLIWFNNYWFYLSIITRVVNSWIITGPSAATNWLHTAANGPNLAHNLVSKKFKICCYNISIKFMFNLLFDYKISYTSVALFFNNVWASVKTKVHNWHAGPSWTFYFDLFKLEKLLFCK